MAITEWRWPIDEMDECETCYRPDRDVTLYWFTVVEDDGTEHDAIMCANCAHRLAHQDGIYRVELGGLGGDECRHDS